MDQLDIDVILARRRFDLRARLSVGAETVALVGASGSGKTSLLRTVAGLDRPGQGRIALGGDVWFDAAARIDRKPEQRRVGYVPQDYGLFPHLTVAGNVRFAGRRDRPDLLERLGIAHLAGVRPAQLSGGERQRAALARALAREPRVLLLDEPFGALDTRTRQRVRDELADMLSALCLPTLLVTHAFDDACAIAARIGVLDEGRLVQLDAPSAVLGRPASATVAALAGANVLAGVAVRAPQGGEVHLDGGGWLACAVPADGAVRIAIYPWEIALTAPGAATLTDRVISVRDDHGARHVRLQRVMVHVPTADGVGVPVEAGALVGVRVPAECVRVLGS